MLAVIKQAYIIVLFSGSTGFKSSGKLYQIHDGWPGGLVAPVTSTIDVEYIYLHQA